MDSARMAAATSGAGHDDRTEGVGRDMSDDWRVARAQAPRRLHELLLAQERNSPHEPYGLTRSSDEDDDHGEYARFGASAFVSALGRDTR
jgi:hypothetical protein